MLPGQLWRVIRRFWLLVAACTVVGVLGFVALAVRPAQTWQSTLTLQVVATDPSQAGSAFLTNNVPGVVFTLGSEQLRKTIRENETKAFSGDFSTTVVNDPDTGVIHVTVSSLNEQLVEPALAAYKSESNKFATAQTLGVPVIGPALPPTQSGKTKKAIVAAIEGFIFGGAIGIFLALGLAKLKSSRDMTGRLERTAHLKTLVRLPEPTEPGAGREDEFILLAADIRADVLSRRATSFAIVSTSPSVTRSVVAAQLARGLAIAGHRVLLVDADLRNPRLEGALAAIDALPVAPFTGMSWLPTETTSVPNLVVLRGSSLPKVVAHLGMNGTGPVRLVSGSLPALVAEASSSNVILIVDCPAVDGSAEANAVISAVDATLIVTSGTMRKRDVDRLAQLNEQIGQLGRNVVGRVAGPKKDYTLRPASSRVPV